MVGTVEAEDCFKDMEKAHMKDNGRSTQKEKLNRNHSSNKKPEKGGQKDPTI